MKGKYLINDLKQNEKTEGTTLIVCFSRTFLVPFFFKALQEMDLPREDIHLLVYDNTEDGLLSAKILDEISRFMCPKCYQFKSVRLFKSYLKGRGNITGSGNEQFRKSKLYNIWHMWKRVYNMVFTPTFFQLEDDTIAPPHAFKRLFKGLQARPKAAMITGISTGRNPMPWVPTGLGVHHMKMKGLKILERHSLSPDTKGVVEIDGCGVYCFAARTKPFLTGFHNYDPEKLRVPFFGMDNIFTYNMKKHGYKLFADFSVWVSHLEVSNARIIAFSKDQAVEMYSVWLPQANNYAQGVLVKAKGQKARRYQVKKLAQTWEL